MWSTKIWLLVGVSFFMVNIQSSTGIFEHAGFGWARPYTLATRCELPVSWINGSYFCLQCIKCSMAISDHLASALVHTFGASMPLAELSSAGALCKWFLVRPWTISRLVLCRSAVAIYLFVEVASVGTLAHPAPPLLLFDLVLRPIVFEGGGFVFWRFPRYLLLYSLTIAWYWVRSFSFRSSTVAVYLFFAIQNMYDLIVVAREQDFSGPLLLCWLRWLIFLSAITFQETPDFDGFGLRLLWLIFASPCSTTAVFTCPSSTSLPVVPVGGFSRAALLLPVIHYQQGSRSSAVEWAYTQPVQHTAVRTCRIMRL